MTEQFFKEAQLIASRNLTPNVAAVSAALKGDHLTVTYYVRGEPTDDDEDEREITVAELMAAYPSKINSCESHFASAQEWTVPPRDERIIWRGGLPIVED